MIMFLTENKEKIILEPKLKTISPKNLPKVKSSIPLSPRQIVTRWRIERIYTIVSTVANHFLSKVTLIFTIRRCTLRAWYATNARNNIHPNQIFTCTIRVSTQVSFFSATSVNIKGSRKTLWKSTCRRITTLKALWEYKIKLLGLQQKKSWIQRRTNYYWFRFLLLWTK